MPSELAKLKRHDYRVSFAGSDLGPLLGEPGIAIRCRRFENRAFDPSANGDVGTEHATIVDATATVTVTTGDIAGALALLAEFSVGDDILAAAKCHALVLAPPENSGERTLAFANACLLPELEYSPKTENHSARLVFRARPNASGALFTFTVPED